MGVTITNLETGEPAGELDATGEVTTDDGELRGHVERFRSDGVEVPTRLSPPPDSPSMIIDGRRTVTPGDEGFAAAVCFGLPEPYLADRTEVMDLEPLAAKPGGDESVFAAEASFGEGDTVEYDSGDHLGVVLEVHTSDFTPLEEDAEENSYEVGDGETVYVVARETEGFGYYTDADLSAGEFPDTPGDPAGDLRDRAAEKEVEAQMSEDALTVAARDATDPAPLAELRAVGAGVPGWVGFPPSWEKSEIPARLILLRAWVSMGASWTGAYETFQKGNTKRGAKKLASSMKDEVYGTTYWR